MKTPLPSIKEALISFFCMLAFNIVFAQNDSLLYGVTYSGSDHGCGVIFHINRNTGIQTVDYSFDTINGGNPLSSLICQNGKLYGMTYRGGIGGLGVIFMWDPVSNSYSKIFDFNSNNDGTHPFGSLSFYNNKFYGTTGSGGVNDMGVIFEWDPNTNTYDKKIDFVGNNGYYPNGSMVIFNGKFYGMTCYVGLCGCGVIFEWDPVTNICIKKIEFDGADKGCAPIGTLVLVEKNFMA